MIGYYFTIDRIRDVITITHLLWLLFWFNDFKTIILMISFVEGKALGLGHFQIKGPR
jgi:hypothetical protein